MRADYHNFSSLRKAAPSTLKKNPRKHGIVVERFMAALDPDFLAGVLAGSQNMEKP